jgi:hypothetical protein
MPSQETGAGETAGVTLRCVDNPLVEVRFRDRTGFVPDPVHYAVELRAAGLDARLDDIVAWPASGDLGAFLAALADDFRGWTGERTWRTADRDLALTAVFRSRGHAGITWTVRPWRTADGAWSASVTTWLEAGEQLSAAAEDIGRFLAPDR